MYYSPPHSQASQLYHSPGIRQNSNYSSARLDKFGSSASPSTTAYPGSGLKTVAFEDSSNRLHNELDKEKKVRIAFETKLLETKQAYAQKEVEKADLEYKVNGLVSEVQNLTIENKSLKAEISRLNQLYTQRIQDLKAELDIETKNSNQITKQYQAEFEKFKAEGQQYVDIITFEYEKRIKALDDKLRHAEANRQEASLEHRRLYDQTQLNRLAHEDQIRSSANRAREEEAKKWQFKLKSVQQRLKSSEDSRQQLLSKIDDLGRNLANKQKERHRLETNLHQQILTLRDQIQSLTQQNSTLKHLLEKARGEISEIEAQRNRPTADGDHTYLKQQLEAKRRECQELSRKVREYNSNIAELSAEHQKKLNELSERCHYFENETRKYQDKYNSVCETLKKKIADTINTVNSTRM